MQISIGSKYRHFRIKPHFIRRLHLVTSIQGSSASCSNLGNFVFYSFICKSGTLSIHEVCELHEEKIRVVIKNDLDCWCNNPNYNVICFRKKLSISFVENLLNFTLKKIVQWILWIYSRVAGIQTITEQSSIKFTEFFRTKYWTLRFSQKVPYFILKTSINFIELYSVIRGSWIVP